MVEIGWSSGRYIYDNVANSLKKYLKDEKPLAQMCVLKDLIKELEAGDCDTLDESFGISPASDLALREAGYHHWGPGCEWLENDSVYETCACGWTEER